VHLSIEQKGLIIVAVPLVCELIFVAGLIVLLQKYDSDIDRQVARNRIVQHATIAERRMASVSCLTLVSSQLGSAEFKHKLDVATEQLRSEFSTLELLTADDPPLLLQIQRVKRSYSKLLEKIKSMEGSRTTAIESVLGNSQDLLEVRRRVEDGGKMLNQFLDQAKIIDNELPANKRQLIDYVGTALLTGITVNIAIAIALAFTFSRNISRRLKRLSENTERMSRDEPMPALVSGNDELAHLDLVLHKMSNDLAAARVKRRELLELVNQSLQAPLTEAEVNLSCLCGSDSVSVPADYLSKIKTADSNMLRLISLLYDLVGMEQLQSGQLELSKSELKTSIIIQRAVEAMQAYASQKSLQISVPTTDYVIFADASRINQVLINLLSNAIKFSPKGAELTIALRRNKQDIEFRVIDQGTGIPGELQVDIFQPYRQSTREDATVRGGAGLGLSICKSIVEAHGGNIGVESSGGRGSQFWFTIPTDQTTDSNSGAKDER